MRIDPPPSLALGAALATLEVIVDENLVDNAARLGEYLTGRLRAIVKSIGGETDVRGTGLMLGVEFTTNGQPNPMLTKDIQGACLKRKLMLLTCGTNGNVLRWLPPLTVTQSEIDLASVGSFRGQRWHGDVTTGRSTCDIA